MCPPMSRGGWASIELIFEITCKGGYLRWKRGGGGKER